MAGRIIIGSLTTCKLMEVLSIIASLIEFSHYCLLLHHCNTHHCRPHCNSQSEECQIDSGLLAAKPALLAVVAVELCTPLSMWTLADHDMTKVPTGAEPITSLRLLTH